MSNGKFFYPASSKVECLNYTYCWSPESIVTGLLNPPDGVTGSCLDGETPMNLFEWNDAEWIEGTWASTRWINRQFVYSNTIRKSIDFPLLQNDVSSPASLSLLTGLKNQVRRVEVKEKERERERKREIGRER